MPDAQTPPWGDDFDAEKAWTLIQNLRSDLTKAKDATTAERQAREAAEAKAADVDPEGKIKAATERAEKAEKALAVKDVLLDFPALKGYEDFLTGSTPEELKASAERLAALGKPAGEPTPKGDEKGGEGSTPPAAPTPQEKLTPGHGGDAPAPFDPDAIATAARS